METFPTLNVGDEYAIPASELRSRLPANAAEAAELADKVARAWLCRAFGVIEQAAREKRCLASARADLDDDYKPLYASEQRRYEKFRSRAADAGAIRTEMRLKAQRHVSGEIERAKLRLALTE